LNNSLSVRANKMINLFIGILTAFLRFTSNILAVILNLFTLFSAQGTTLTATGELLGVLLIIGALNRLFSKKEKRIEPAPVKSRKLRPIIVYVEDETTN